MPIDLPAIRQAILDAPDTVCLERARLATEGYRRFDKDPVPLKRARTFAHILLHMTLDLESNPWFAGNTSTGPRAWMLLPEYGFSVPAQAGIEAPSLVGHLDGEAIPRDVREFWEGRSLGLGPADIGHLAPDFETVLAEGLEGVIARLEAAGRGDSDSDRRVFRDAAVLGCRAVIDWTERYAVAAANRADTAQDPGRRALFRRVAVACRQVPARPPRDLFEALQAVVLLHFAIHVEGHGYSVSPGRLDRLLAPYDRSEPEAGDWIAAFLLKLFANSLWGSHSKTQCITLGGADAEGRDACNRLTGLFLGACEAMRVPDPHLFLRWHSGLDPTIRRQAVAMLGRGVSMPMLVGDAETTEGLTAARIDPADARDYCVIGCNEIGIPGTLLYDPIGFSEMEALLRVLRDETSPPPRTGQELAARVAAAFETATRAARTAHEAVRDRRLRLTPTPFTSALLTGHAEAGRDLHAWMPVDVPVFGSRNFVNFVNGLAAIEAVVLRRNAYSWDALRDAIQTDFSGDDDLRSALWEAPKWGNDEDSVDALAERWLAQRRSIFARIAGGDGRHLVCHVVRSLHHADGARAGATPDGRRAGEPFADSLGPHPGTLRQGPTAVLNSVRRLAPARHWAAGTNLNLTLPLALVRHPDDAAKTAALIDAFFAHGGQELQLGCLDVAQLRAARESPERYPDLLVRVAGFNALFAKLSPAEQDEMIARAEGWRGA